MAWTKKTINKLYQLKEEGYSILEISQQIGVSTRVVANAIKRKTKSSSMKKTIWTEETTDLLKQLREDGLSMSEIAKKLGVSKNTIAGKLYRLKSKNNLSPIEVEKCPYCNSNEFDITDETSKDLSMQRDCKCLNCDKEFTLCYDLTLTNTIKKE